MMRSLYSAVAGLKNHQTKMDVIGNNISNVNTVAFKSSSVTFSDIIYQTLSGASGPNQTLGGVNAKQIGLGMSTAATSMNITGSGSAQTTGKPFDLRLNDAGNSTNFFVVNNGTQNVYTRDGCFYIDGAGTLCMDSTGYKLMGWLADKDTGEVITSGDVVPLSIMDTPNLTSPPEATEMAYSSGIIDKDTPDLSSTQGYTMALEFFDDLGYPYSARFTVRLASDDGSVYTVKLSQILDQNGVDVLKEVMESQGISLDQVFGSASTSNFSLNAGIPYITSDNLSTGTQGDWVYDTAESTTYSGGIVGHISSATTGESIYFNKNGKLYEDKAGTQAWADTHPTQNWGQILNLTHTWSDAESNTISIDGSGNFTLKQITAGEASAIEKANWYFLSSADAAGTWPVTYGNYTYPDPAVKNPSDTWAGYFINISTNRLVAVNTAGILYEYDNATDKYVASSLGLDNILEGFDADTSSMSVSGKTLTATYTDYDLTFSKADGSFAGIDDQDSVFLYGATLGPNFHNISIDFTALRNANNGKKSTAGMDSGTSAIDTTGAGKKLGSLVGVAVQNDGKIYGSYDNGNTVLLGQIASAHFANASGLEKIGESCYDTTLNSGDAVIGDISADGSSMTSGEIEMSNVDLSAEFTDMITTQRGFQANSRVITTSDTLLEELINLKR